MSWRRRAEGSRARQTDILTPRPSFLPFYQRGNLQDLMTQVSVTGNRVEEDRLLRLFHGTCLG